MTGVVVLVAVIAAFAPAALLDGPLAARTQQRLRLVGATGPWWRGNGLVASADGTSRIPVSWHLDAAALLHGALGVRIGDGDEAGPRATIAVTGARTDVHAFHARVPAALLGAFDPRLQSMALGGSVIVEAPDLSIARDGITGAINATWTNARVVVGDAVIDAGSVTLTKSPAAQPATAIIANTGGDVAVTGTIVDRAGVSEGSVELRPAPTASVAVRNALSIVGNPDATGAVRVAWRGQR